ncbi:hypothetical protein PMAYCL1PPCAC_30298 [Pristionchus mayeri]|uniref:Uncharacterized protein n=1 Tax=Pristionchus mayeri TaxID=1317129 RepID=A0AAN5IBK8_9BILA|nr:hypothetical protein PMAYCL1PPCAC_30298 [Pristionchus mayeri]
MFFLPLLLLLPFSSSLLLSDCNHCPPPTKCAPTSDDSVSCQCMEGGQNMKTDLLPNPSPQVFLDVLTKLHSTLNKTFSISQGNYVALWNESLTSSDYDIDLSYCFSPSTNTSDFHRKAHHIAQRFIEFKEWAEYKSFISSIVTCIFVFLLVVLLLIICYVIYRRSSTKRIVDASAVSYNGGDEDKAPNGVISFENPTFADQA